MNDDAAVPPSLFTTAIAELAAAGVRLTARPGEYCVGRRDDAAAAYVTDDLLDAIAYGRALACAAPQPGETGALQPAGRRRPPVAMTPKAWRRRMIRRHNGRRRARLLRQQRKGTLA
ncbi:MAG TPA: hypothetical protein VME41_07385 [Stellaceae bacterium]|nr:hypothetical protein [Stellaceae bacterium]